MFLRNICHSFERMFASQTFGGLAQLGEHLPCTQGVKSSILLSSTNFSVIQKDNCTLKTVYVRVIHIEKFLKEIL